jgi:hypothetical protein
MWQLLAENAARYQQVGIEVGLSQLRRPQVVGHALKPRLALCEYDQAFLCQCP